MLFIPPKYPGFDELREMAVETMKHHLKTLNKHFKNKDFFTYGQSTTLNKTDSQTTHRL